MIANNNPNFDFVSLLSHMIQSSRYLSPRFFSRVIDWRTPQAGTPIVLAAARSSHDWSASRSRRHHKRLLS